MNILKTSKELTVRERYKLTMDPGVKKMKNAIGSRVDVAAYCIYADEDKDGKPQEILSIMTPEGEVFATNSPTFKRDFEKMVDVFTDGGETLDAIKVISGESKNGREFITCTLAD